MHARIRVGLHGLTMVGMFFAATMGTSAIAQTPETRGCDEAGTPVAAMDHGAMGAGDATPAMEMREVEFDQMYIDMMLPHHGSIIALAEVALPLLGDPRLREMAQSIIDSQTAEQAELRALRAEWYGSPEPAPMDDAMMSMMMEAMPGMGTAEEQMRIMDAGWQVQTFCATDDRDLAFIDQTIPHHQMAIVASEVALTQAVHPELVTIAEEVIAAQQAEIDQLETIRAELTGAATPAS